METQYGFAYAYIIVMNNGKYKKLNIDKSYGTYESARMLKKAVQAENPTLDIAVCFVPDAVEVL